MTPETKQQTAQDVAQELYESFETRKRPDESTFITLTEEAQRANDWRMDAARAAHGDMLPDDYRYQWALEAAEGYSDREPHEWDSVNDEIEADVYTHDLTKWLHSHDSRTGYMDEAMGKFGFTDTNAALACAQYLEIREVYWTIRQAIEDEADERGTEQ